MGRGIVVGPVLWEKGPGTCGTDEYKTQQSTVHPVGLVLRLGLLIGQGAVMPMAALACG